MSPLVTQKIPPMVGGVSQLPPELRSPGQLAEAINTFPSDVLGLSVRRGTTSVAPLGTASVSGEHAVEYSPAAGERYLFRLTAAGVSMIDTVTGTSRTVTTSGDLSAFLASGQFASAVVGNAVYVASKGYSKAQWTSKKSPVAPAAALVNVRQGAPSNLYKLVIDGQTVSVRTPDDPADSRVSIGIDVDASNAGTPQSVTVSPTSASVVRGNSTSIGVNLTRQSGYTGSVTLAATAPTGYIVNFSSTILGSGTASTIANVYVPADAPVGLATVTITSSGGGQTAYAILTLNVTSSGGGGGGGGGGSYSLDSAGVTVEQGATGIAAINIVRSDGYAKAVTLTAITVPAGLSVTFGGNPITPTASAAQLNVTADIGLAPGAYTIHIQGADVDALTYTLGVPVTVYENGTGGGSGSIGVAVSPASATVAAGYAQTFSVDITRLGGFAGQVSLTTTTVPSGFSAAFSGTPLASTATHATLTVIVPSWATPGTYAVSFVAAGPGGTPIAEGTLTIFAVKNTDPSIAWSYYNVKEQDAQSFNDGQNSLTIERLGFYADDVTLAVTSTSHAGLTAYFNPTILTGGGTNTLLYWAFDPATPPGTYYCYLSASGPGVTTVHMPFTIYRS